MSTHTLWKTSLTTQSHIDVHRTTGSHVHWVHTISKPTAVTVRMFSDLPTNSVLALLSSDTLHVKPRAERRTAGAGSPVAEQAPLKRHRARPGRLAQHGPSVSVHRRGAAYTICIGGLPVACCAPGVGRKQHRSPGLSTRDAPHRVVAALEGRRCPCAA